jgi:seryl-tRNA synthetase
MKYLEGLPEGMYYCSAPRRDPEVFEKFKNELLIKKEVPIERLKDGLKDPSYVLALNYLIVVAGLIAGKQVELKD